MNYAKLPDELAEALGRVVAEHERKARKEIERIEMESRAVVAELRADIVHLKAQLSESWSQAEARITEKLAIVKDGRDGVDGKNGEPGERGEMGVPGVPGRDAIDGKDGAPGRDGVDGQTGAAGRDGLSGVPGVNGRDGFNGKDGAPGKDGRDGLGFDDLQPIEDTLRYGLRFSRGDQVKELWWTKPTLADFDTGIWKEGTAYTRGSMVTYSGSAFIARADTSAKPETSQDWRLFVKRGRDGKDGAEGKPGPIGMKGDKGDAGPRAYGG